MSIKVGKIMNNQDYNKFLHKLYDLLLKDGIINYDKEVSSSKEKTERIKKYLEKLDRVQNKALDNERYLEMIKNLYYDRYIIKEEDIPTSYFKMLEEKYLEEGRGYINLVSPKTKGDKNLREERVNTIIREQKESLNEWLNYLLSPDSSYLEIWAKVWAFQGILDIGALNSEKTMRMKRNKNTVAPFVQIDSEILGKCIEYLKESLKREKIEDKEINELVKSGSFAKLYSKLLLNKKKVRLNGNDGKWVKYYYETIKEADEKEKSNIKPEYLKLYESLQGYNTGWCTAGSRRMAKEQICGRTSYQGGDFYVYYSIDENNEYNIPRIAIRMEQNNICEIRGIAKGQNIEPGMEEILREKLKEFPDAKNYQKKVSDMNNLTKIYNKYINKLELTRGELRFLYEIDEEISGFGYQKDPRIEEILTIRNSRKDLSYIFDCHENEIGFNIADLGRNLIYFHGDLSLDEITSSKGLVLPQNIRGSLYLNGLISAKGLVLPQNIGGSLHLNGLTNAEGLILPKNIRKNLYLNGITGAEGLILPQNTQGSLSLAGLTNAKELVLPQIIGGNLSLDKLTSAKGLILPQNIGGDLYLYSLISLKELVLPQSIGGEIFYKNCLYTLEELRELQKEEELAINNSKKRVKEMGYANTLIIIVSTLLICLIGIIIGNVIIK